MDQNNEFVWSPGRGNIPVTGDFVEIQRRMDKLEKQCEELRNWVREIFTQGKVKPMSDAVRRIEEFTLLD